MPTLMQDIRYAIRGLLRSPAFTIAAVVTLGLGIGATTTIFSVVNAVLIQPLPLPDPDQLVLIREDQPPQFSNFSVSPANYLDYRAQNHVLTDATAYNGGSYTVTGSGEAESISGTEVTASFFPVSGLAPVLGRALTEQDTRIGADPVVVISHGLWLRRFGGDSRVLDQSLQIEGESYRIVGVMPQGVQFPSRGNQLWLPLILPRDVESQRGAHYLNVIGRLRPGVRLDAATADLKRIALGMAAAYPRTNKGWTASPVSLREAAVGRVRPALLILLAAVAMVALIACVNVANLMMARATARQGEIGVRAALGASRTRLLRQLLTESLLLAALGGGLALLLSTWGLDVITRLGESDIPRLEQVTIDRVVIGFTAAAVLLATLLFGLWPAMHVTNPDLVRSLQLSGRRAGTGREGARVRNGLVVAEVALALTLLAGAGLLIRSFVHLQGVDPGFDPRGVVTFDLSIPDLRYPDGDRTAAFYHGMSERIATIPGVKSVGAIFGLPLTDFGFSSSFQVEGAPVPPEDEPSAQVRLASGEYFHTVGISVKKGRGFTTIDRRGSTPVILASEAAAKKFWPNGDAIGHKVIFGARPGRERIQGEIVGIVSDVRAFGLDQDLTPMFYGNLEQVKVGFASFVVKSQGDSTALFKAIRSEVAAVDQDLPVVGLTTLGQVVGVSIARPRFYMTLLTAFAGVALVLAAVGIYGVFSYLVSQRVREIGIRLALGAGRTDVLSLVIGRAMRLVLLGLSIGLVATFAMNRIITRLLFGIDSTDPFTIAAVSFLLAAVGFTACYLPARRASRVDPAIALRSE